MHRELQRFETRDLHKDLSGLSRFLQDLKSLSPTPDETCFLIQRNGYILKVTEEILEACHSLPPSSKHKLNQPYLLFLLYPRGIQHIPPRFTRILWKYKLDGMVIFSLEEPDHLLLLNLKIENFHWVQELEMKEISLPEFRRLYQEEWFRTRTEDLEALDEEEEEVAEFRAICLALEFTTKSIEIPFSPVEEFHSLAKTLGFEILADESQKLSKPQTGTFLGKGKFEEIVSRVEMGDFSHLLINCDVPASFKRKFTEETLLPVWDRTDLILEIFRFHARTERSRLQVDLAKLYYHSDQIIHDQLQGPEIGFRRREIHKDKIRSRINERRREIKDELEKLKTQDENRLQSRLKENPFAMALIGYTNAGKSSLFNGLLGRHEVEVENLLFKTLDTTTRALELSNQSRILITDTVGFIQKLPPHLQEAFTTTLSESRICSHLLILLDPIGIPMETQQEVLRDTLQKIGRTDEENWFWAINKVDLFSTASEARRIADQLGVEYLVSATDPNSARELKESILEKLFSLLAKETLYLDYDEYGKLHALREIATLEQEPAYLGTHLEIQISFSRDNTHRIEKIFGRSLDELTQPRK